MKTDRFVLDGELLIPGQSFETLQLRLHPAASRIAELSGKFPARPIVFDLLAFGNAKLTRNPLSERREAESLREEVAELSADHISGGQFRHGSRLIRWRTDKAPRDCTMDQLRR